MVRELSIGGAWEFRPTVHSDLRGLFLEGFNARSLHEATGRGLVLSQINVSVSRQGVIRGIHAAHSPPGQAKYVMCLAGQVLDVIVDLRKSSPTFGQSHCLLLDDDKRNAVFISEDLGHGFQVVSQSATVMYATSTPYDVNGEFVINPLDRDLALPWLAPMTPILSERDRKAPGLAQSDQTTSPT